MILNTEDIINSSHVREELAEFELYGETEYDGDELANIRDLQKLNEWAESSVTDWAYGSQLIHEDYFTQYITEQTYELNEELFKNMPDYVKHNIDWDGVADVLREDYSSYDFNGVTYYGLTS